MRILICEDEFIIADNLNSYCEDLGYTVIGIASSKSKAIELIETLKPDIVLLDINLEGNKEGVEIAQYINNHIKIPFIYITAYSDPETFIYAGQTFPSAYIIKPVDEITLKINIELAQMKFKNKLHLNDDILQAKSSLIKSPKDISQIDFNICTYVEATQNYLHFYFTNNDKCILRHTIADLEKVIPTNFTRVHKSYIVNLNFVSTFLSGKLNVLGTWIPVGRVYKGNLDEFLNY